MVQWVLCAAKIIQYFSMFICKVPVRKEMFLLKKDKI